MKIDIRIAVPDDAITIAAFNQAMAKETEAIVLDEAVALAGALAVLNGPHHGFYLVAEVDDVPAASLMVTFEWSDWRNCNKWWIQSVYVKPAYRVKGLYTALYQRVKSEATAHLVNTLHLYVDETNVAARQVYERLGMKKSHYVLYEDHL